MPDVAIIGAGPAGLFAAERLSESGLDIRIYERMPSPARKFLLAGLGGLNLTHSEPIEGFVTRFGPSAIKLEPMLQAFPPAALRQWADDLGQETFVGSSGRVFPRSLKASPLLRAWLRRLDGQGVTLKTGHHWRGWSADGALQFSAGGSDLEVKPRATLLALGGASWPRLGSDGQWTVPLTQKSVSIAPLQPANSGFLVPWSDYITQRFAGTPLKRIALTFNGQTVRGEAMLTKTGIEGGVVYALGAALRNTIQTDGTATMTLDLRPDFSEKTLAERLERPRGRDSFANVLRKQMAMPPVGLALLRESVPDVINLAPRSLARLIKAVPVTLTGVNPIDRAISTAGGVRWSECDANLMLKALPGVFCAGEMLDWEAPTGGYLLQGCFSSGAVAANGIIQYLTPAKSP